jgi:hypothetical protein
MNQSNMTASGNVDIDAERKVRGKHRRGAQAVDRNAAIQPFRFGHPGQAGVAALKNAVTTN